MRVIGPATEADMVTAFRDAEPESWAGRGYPDRYIFQRFPMQDCRWEWVSLTADELANVQQIREPTWLGIAGPDLRPAAALAWVHQHPEHDFSETVRAIHERFARGDVLPPIVLVGPRLDAQLVVLEGNRRTVAAMMGAAAGDVDVAELTFIVGTAKAMTEWAFY